MKRNEFDLTGKAIDCASLINKPWGKQVLEVLKAHCVGETRKDNMSFERLSKGVAKYLVNFQNALKLTNAEYINHHNLTLFQPLHILGKARLDAIEDGGTVVFEGDEIPAGVIKRYIEDGSSEKVMTMYPEVLDSNKGVIAYKLLDVSHAPVAPVNLKTREDVIEWIKNYFDKWPNKNEFNGIPAIPSFKWQWEKSEKGEVIMVAFGEQITEEHVFPTSIESKVLAEKTGRKHSHYFKDVSHLNVIDVYRVGDLFEIDDPSGSIQHAVKKLLCGGIRGAKDARKDLEEARDTIIRKLEMMEEDGK